jgi:hypothetical protein
MWGAFVQMDLQRRLIEKRGRAADRKAGFCFLFYKFGFEAQPGIVKELKWPVSCVGTN